MQDMIYFHIAATENDAASYGTHGISQTVNEFETNLMTFLFFFFCFYILTQEHVFVNKVLCEIVGLTREMK